MGILGKLIGRGGEDDEPDVDIEEEFGDAVIDDDGVPIGEEGEVIGEGDDEEVEEEEEMEWDSAYDFAGWWLEDEGFANMRDFGEKAIMYRLERSDMYRDRIESGMRTLSMVNEANSQLKELRGKGKSDKDYEAMAKKIQNANEVIEGVRSLSGEDEVIVQQGMSLARDAISAIGSRAQSSGGAVDTDMKQTEDRI
mgnify:CR=1 FL=1